MQKRRHVLYPFFSLLIGLFLAQVLATVQVYLSNMRLYENLHAIREAGYLAVPNPYIMDQLHSITPAVCAGFFFTFSIGAGISFLALASAWIWDRLFSRSKYLFYLLILLWVLCLIAVNFHRFDLLVSLYFFVIPPAVFGMAAGSLTRLSRQKKRRNEVLHILPIIVLAFLLSWQLDNRIFTDFRDVFLLSNAVGSRINSFYYRYTLYAAEVFKSFDQKMLKTCSVEKKEENEAPSYLEKILSDYDCIPLKSRTEVDFKIAITEDDFTFTNRNGPVLRISSEAFFADPGKAIKEFAQKSDAFAFFRKSIFLSLLFGFPLAVYVLGHGLIAILFSLFTDIRKSSAIASALCFGLCLILFFSFHFNRSRDPSRLKPADALNSDRWQARVAALKTIDQKGLEIKQFEAYPRLLASTNIAERYWFVRALAHSRSPSTYRDLLQFLDDPHPNVRAMAFYALGKRGHREAIAEIIRKMEAAKDWYSQWYAYNALKSLGWRQTKSN